MTTTVPPPDPESSAGAGAPRGRGMKVAAWIVGSVAVLVLLILAAAAVFLHSSRGHNYLLHLAEAKASDALGTKVHLQNFALHLSKLSVDIYGVRIDGAEPYPNPPLLLVQHIEADVQVVSVWHRKWHFDRLRVDHPVVRVFVGADGVSNLPKLKTGGGSHTSVFDLGVRHVVLDGGEIYYNDRKSELGADLHDVNLHAAFDSLENKYSGELSYRHGHLQAAGFSPIAHSLDAKFEATPTQFTLTEATITSGSSRFTLVATLKNYSDPRLQGRYKAVLDGGDLRRILRNPSIPTGVVYSHGTVAYRYDPKLSMLDSVIVNGDLNSGQLNVQASGVRTQLNDVVAHYSLADGNLTVKNLRARLLGGSLVGTVEMHDISGATQSKLNATLRGISVAELKRVAPASPATRALGLGGILNASADATWGKTMDSLVVHTDATIHANVSSAGNAGARSSDVVPVEGAIHGSYSAATRRFALSKSHLQMPETTLTMNGAVGTRAGLAIHLHSKDLRELETVADLVHLPKPGKTVRALGLAGTATFDGVVRGSTSAPDLTGRLTASNLQIKGTTWKTLRTDVELSPSIASLQHAELVGATHGHIGLNATAHWRDWSFTSHTPIQVELHASQVDIASLEKITGSTIPVSGSLAANLKAHGTLLDLSGQGNVSLANAKVYDEPIQSANLTFTGEDDQIHAKLSAHVAGGTVDSVVTVRPNQKSYVAQITTTGIELAKLQALKTRNIEAAGAVNLQGSGQGSWDNPQFTATLQIPKLEVQQQVIKGVALQMDVANHVANASLNSNALGTVIHASAKVNLTGDYVVDAKLDTQPIQLQPLLAMYAPSQVSGVDGETEVHATLHGPLKNKKLLEGHVTVPMLKLGYGNAIHLAATSPLHIDYKNGVIDLQRASIQGTNTDLQIQGTVPVIGHAPASVLLLGTVNLRLAQLLDPDIRSSGQLKFNINSYGARADADVEGQIQIVNANISNGAWPIGVQHANGVLLLTKDRLNVQSFKARVGGGTVTAQGGVAYRPSVQFDLGLTANGIRMLYPEGVREEIGADIRLAGSSTNAVLGGRVRVENLSFTPNFDLMNFISQLSGGVAPPPSRGFSQNLQLNLAVSSVNNMNLVSRTLSVDGTANLQVRGTAADPVILGRINLNDGDLIFNGNRFTLDGGTVEFVNPAQTQPVVNLALNTTIQQYNIHLRFNGPVDQLRTNYASDPALPAADIINLLAFGQTTEYGAANPTPGNQAAMSAVASQVSSQITSRVSKIAGISQLSINPVLAGGGSQGPAGAVVTIQQRVTGNLFVTFSTNVTSTQSQVIMGQYKVSKRLSVSATRDQNGGFGFDVLLKRRW